MKIQISIVLLCSLVIAEAAVSRLPLEPCPGHPGRCYSKGPPEINMAVGESKQVSGSCERMTCEKAGDRFIVEFAGCGVATGPDGCRMVDDLSKPYPECCNAKPGC